MNDLPVRKNHLQKPEICVLLHLILCKFIEMTEFVSMCPSPFGTELVKNEYKQNAKVNQLILFLIVTRRLEIICYTCITKNVHLTTTTTNFLFFLKQDLTSIYLS